MSGIRSHRRVGARACAAPVARTRRAGGRQLWRCPQECRDAGIRGKQNRPPGIEAGLEPDFQMVDLISLVRRSVERANALPTPRAVALSFVEPGARVLVRADAAGLSQVVDNLLHRMNIEQKIGSIDKRPQRPRPGEFDRLPRPIKRGFIP